MSKIDKLPLMVAQFAALNWSSTLILVMFESIVFDVFLRIHVLAFAILTTVVVSNHLVRAPRARTKREYSEMVTWYHI